jgi:hypothetical protein
MARKTTGSAPANRSKKPATSSPSLVQAVSDAGEVVGKGGRTKKVSRATPDGSLEEQIRLRAYELYLERRATAGAGSGDESQDWLIAEREVRSRQGDSHSA